MDLMVPLGTDSRTNAQPVFQRCNALAEVAVLQRRATSLQSSRAFVLVAETRAHLFLEFAHAVCSSPESGVLRFHAATAREFELAERTPLVGETKRESDEVDGQEDNEGYLDR